MRKWLGWILAALLLISARVVAAPVEVTASHGMVASANRLASEVGVDVMRRGGNAVDAAVAVALSLAVTYPEAGNLGGGGFMMIRMADGRVTAIDYRETAPAAATRTMYVDEKGNLIQGEGSSTVGYRAAGVPGTVAGLSLALQQYGSGKLAWDELIEPARSLAVEGYALSPKQAQALRDDEKLLSVYPQARHIFLRDGRLYKAGERFRQPELAATLSRLQRDGPAEFYNGETAHRIVDDMKRHGGLVTMRDLENYRPRERVPIRGTYRGLEVISMPPPSSGGVVLIEMLNILEGYDLTQLGFDSPQRMHLMVEAMRRAFADRSQYMGDPDFVDVPVATLTDKAYAARRRATISPDAASTSASVKGGLPSTEPQDTTHFTVVDARGNAVSNTYTLNGSFGSGAVVRDTGMLLNNEMDDFASRPDTPNLYGLIQGERNSIAPGKRPLSSMTPTFVLHPDGRLWFAVGSPGGPTIINTVLQVIVDVADFHMSIQQAVAAPRLHHQWLPDEIVFEPHGLDEAAAARLQQMGHHLTSRPRSMGDAQGILIDAGGMLHGGSDPRGDGAAVGY